MPCCCSKSSKMEEKIELKWIKNGTPNCKCNFMKQMKKFEEDSDNIIKSFSTCREHELIFSFYSDKENTFYCEECTDKPDKVLEIDRRNDNDVLLTVQQYFLDIMNYRMKMKEDTDNRTEMLDSMQEYENKALKLLGVWKKFDSNLKYFIADRLPKLVEKWSEDFKGKGEYISMDKDRFKEKDICLCGKEFQNKDHEQSDADAHLVSKGDQGAHKFKAIEPITVSVKDTAKTDVSKTFVSKLDAKLAEHNILIINGDDQTGKKMNLLAICIKDTRIESNIEAALNKVCCDNYNKVALITVHCQSKDYFSEGDSQRVVDTLKTKNEKYANVILATDWSFKKRHMESNSYQEDKLLAFLKSETAV